MIGRKEWIGASINDNLCALSKEFKCIKQCMRWNENKKKPNGIKWNAGNIIRTLLWKMDGSRCIPSLLNVFMVLFSFFYSNASILRQWCLSLDEAVEMYLMVVAFVLCAHWMRRRKLKSRELKKKKRKTWLLYLLYSMTIKKKTKSEIQGEKKGALCLNLCNI